MVAFSASILNEENLWSFIGRNPINARWGLHVFKLLVIKFSWMRECYILLKDNFVWKCCRTSCHTEKISTSNVTNWFDPSNCTRQKFEVFCKQLVYHCLFACLGKLCFQKSQLDDLLSLLRLFLESSASKDACVELRSSFTCDILFQ